MLGLNISILMSLFVVTIIILPVFVYCYVGITKRRKLGEVSRLYANAIRFLIMPVFFVIMVFSFLASTGVLDTKRDSVRIDYYYEPETGTKKPSFDTENDDSLDKAIEQNEKNLKDFEDNF